MTAPYYIGNLFSTLFLGVGLDKSEIPERPTNKADAVRRFHKDHPEEWAAMAKEGWGLKESEAHLLSPSGVIGTINDTNNRTVEHDRAHLWVDPLGRYKVTVFF